MTQPSFPSLASSSYLSVLGHNIHLTTWGAPDLPPLVLWHGLARTGRDFDACGRALADRFWVLCPDTIGRGLSSWSQSPHTDYTIPSYCTHALGLLDQLGIQQCAWVGTSMGGIIGMILASQGKDSRINRLVLNDIGPLLEQEALQRISDYTSTSATVPTVKAFEKLMRRTYASFGVLSDETWQHIAETSLRRKEDGGFSSHYDPAVMEVFAAMRDVPSLWDFYDRITCPTLVLRGAVSDLLSVETAVSMTTRGPRARLETIPGCGHAPSLMVESEIALVQDFLLQGRGSQSSPPES